MNKIKKATLLLVLIVILTGCSSKPEQNFLDQGRVYVSRAEYNKALTEFLNGIKTSPEEEEYYLLAAEIYLKKGDYKKAIEVLSDGFSKTTSSTLAAGIGEIFLINGNLNEAEKWYSQAIELDKTNIDAVKGKIKYLSSTDKKEEINILLEQIPVENYDSELYIIKAILQLKEPEEASKSIMLSATKGGEYIELTRQLKSAFSLYQEDRSVHNLSEISYILLNNGWYEIANLPISLSIAENQFYETGYLYRGLTNLNTSRYEEAVKSFETVLEINPENIDAKVFVIQVKYLMQNNNEAKIKAEELVSGDVKLNANQVISLVEILYKNDELKLIDDLLVKYSDLKLPATETSVLVEAYLELGKYQKSEVLAKEALSSKETLPTASLRARFLTLRGYAQFNLNQKQEGLDAMEEAITIDSTQPTVHYYYGKALLENGNESGGLASIERAIDSDLDGLITFRAQKLLQSL